MKITWLETTLEEIKKHRVEIDDSSMIDLVMALDNVINYMEDNGYDIVTPDDEDYLYDAGYDKDWLSKLYLRN